MLALIVGGQADLGEGEDGRWWIFWRHPKLVVRDCLLSNLVDA